MTTPNAQVDEMVAAYREGRVESDLTTDPRTDPVAALAYANCMAWPELPKSEPVQDVVNSDKAWFGAVLTTLQGLGWDLTKAAE